MKYAIGLLTVLLLLSTPAWVQGSEESPAGDNYRYYADKDGLDQRIGDGLLELVGGYNYTPLSDGKTIEVRNTSSDTVVGYALLIPVYDEAKGELTGWEKPIGFIDKDEDGLVSVSELETALDKMEEYIEEDLKTDALSVFTTYTEMKRVHDGLEGVDLDAEPARNKVLDIIAIIFVASVFILLYWWMSKGSSKKKKEGTA